MNDAEADRATKDGRTVKDAVETWRSWRGSPELVAHIARVARRSVEDATGTTQAPLWVVVRVDDDTEMFRSIEDFLERVTPEGLRRLFMLRLIAGDERLTVEVRFVRVAPAVRLFIDRGDSISDDAVKALECRLGKAIARGFRWRDEVYGWAFVLGVLAAAITAASWLDEGTGAVAFAAGAGAAGALLVAQEFVVPHVEVAPPGQIRLAQFGRILLTIIVGLIGAAIGKQLFG